MLRPIFESATASLADAQHDMRHAYAGGAPGMLVSASLWVAAGLVCVERSPERGVWTLLIGGALIHPLSVLVYKAIGRPGRHARGNPLASLAWASTLWLVLMLPLAYAASRLRIEWFFPAMLLVIGGRYLTFATLYGTRLYLACGAVLALAGWLLGQALAPPALAAFAGAGLEGLFAIALFATGRHRAGA
jgi:hypothetical protein